MGTVYIIYFNHKNVEKLLNLSSVLQKVYKQILKSIFDVKILKWKVTWFHCSKFSFLTAFCQIPAIALIKALV